MTKDELKDRLFRNSTRLFALLDGASIEDLPMRLFEMNPVHRCLLRGNLEPDLAETAPYLIFLGREEAFTDWVLENCFGKHWGIFIDSTNSLNQLRRHFMSLLTVYNEKGDPMFFRFYDPRVINAYLPTCNAQELGKFFGPVGHYFAENKKTRSLEMYGIDQGSIKKTTLKKG